MILSRYATRLKGFWALIVLLGLALGACNGALGAPNDPVSDAETLPSPVATIGPTEEQPKQLGQEADEPAMPPAEADPTQVSAGSPTPVVDPPTEEAANPEPTPFIFVPSNRTALVSTNPADFNLTAGQLQFVEFMAFW